MPMGLLKCARCKGTGTRDRDGRDPACEVCNGKGQIFMRLPALPCQRCQGDGTRDRDGRDPICPTCDGTGWVPADDFREY